MLHWLRMLFNLHKSPTHLFRDLFLAVLTIHLLLLSAFLLYQAEITRVTISRDLLNKNRTVVYVPWVKRFNSSKSGIGVQSRNANNGHKPEENISSAVITSCAISKTKFVSSLPSKKTKKKNAHQKKTSKKEVQKKNEKKSKLKKPEIQKSKIEPKKGKVKKNLSKKEIEKEAKKTDAKKDLPKSPPKSTIDKQEFLPKEGDKNSTEQVGIFDVQADGPIYIGRDELQSFQLGRVMYEEISQVWKPPAGFSWREPCQVKVKIDNDGKVTSAVIEKSSGIVVVDISITQALKDMSFSSPLAFNKEFILNFVG